MADLPPVCVEEYEERAAARLPIAVWDYLAGGSGSESTLAANRAAFQRLALRPRFLVDVSHRDTGTTLLGSRLAAPIGVAPMAYHRLFHPDGEVGVARAAGETGTLFVVSFFASQLVEDIAAAAAGPLWLQVYWLKQRDALLDLMGRAQAAGFEAVVLTVDTPQVGRRRRDLRNGWAIPPDVAAVNLAPTVMAGAHHQQAGVSALEKHSRDEFDPSLSWHDLAWLRENSPLPVVVKGVLTGPDAARCVEEGVSAVIVSNHGGRQLDGAIATVDALPEVVDAVAGRCPVLVDGGVRTGADVLRALALGADTVLVGRPVLWGLACDGTAGAAAVLRMLVQELGDAMVLAGRPRLSDVDATLVRKP